MEIEQSPQILAKKIWNIVRIVFMMLKTSISKSKLVLDIHLMIKRGNKLANKAIDTLLLHHHHHLAALSCRSDDAHLSFISPKEYEFSCSNSPVFAHRRKNHYHHHHGRHWSKSLRYNDVTTVAAVQRVLEMLNDDAVAAATAVEASPLVLPGFGRSPLVRQLRVTDSPFPVKDDGDGQVDKAAEEFINKFYKDLRSQKRMAALESPYRGAWVT